MLTPRRFRVVYRLANQVYVMGVAPAHGNVFFAARVVNAATHHLVAVNRGISVTPDRIANRFPEVLHDSLTAVTTPECSLRNPLQPYRSPLHHRLMPAVVAVEITCQISPCVGSLLHTLLDNVPHCAKVYLAFAELIANGGKLQRATAGAEASIDSLSSEAARTVKQLKKSFTASLSIRKSASSLTKQVQPDAASTMGGGRCLP